MSAQGNWNDEFDEPLEPILEMLSKTSRELDHGVVEAFLRTSTSRRVELDGRTGEIEVRSGREQGGALRWWDPERGLLGFAAASGRGERAVEACRGLARSTPGRPSKTCPWNPTAGPSDDLDDPVSLPSTDEMADWLRATAPEGLDRAWVEVGNSAETWLTGPENPQKRGRQRAWGCWESLGDGSIGPRPSFLARRGWTALRRLDPRQRLRGDATAGERPWPTDAKWVLTPEMSAFLTLLLVRVGHHPGVSDGAPVGSGWVVSSAGPETLFGSVCDDAGFSTEMRPLADGRRVVGRWGGPGQLRRGSFRDEPVSTPIPLIVTPPAVDPPRRAVLVNRIEVHPAGSAWIMRFFGREYPDGASFVPHEGRFDPHRLTQACVGGVGPALESHSGVTSPSLVFDALLLDRA